MWVWVWVRVWVWVWVWVWVRAEGWCADRDLSRCASYTQSGQLDD